MTRIEALPDEVTGDVVIGPWRHYGFCMRGELVYSAHSSIPAEVTVWLVNPLAGLKWEVCRAKAAYTISDVVFAEPFTWNAHYSQSWRSETLKQLIEHSPGLWHRTVSAQLMGAYMQAQCAPGEVPC